MEPIFPVVSPAQLIFQRSLPVFTLQLRAVYFSNERNKYAEGKDFDMFALWNTLLSIPVRTSAAHGDSDRAWVPQRILGLSLQPVPGSPDAMRSFAQQLNEIKYPEVILSISKLKPFDEPVAHLCSFPSKKIFFFELQCWFDSDLFIALLALTKQDMTFW